METPCPCLGTSTIEREEETGVLIWHILPPAHLLMPDYGPLPVNMYDLYNQAKFLKRQLHQISKDQVTIVILLEKKTYSCKFLPGATTGDPTHDKGHAKETWQAKADQASRDPLNLLEHLPQNQNLSYYFVPFTNSSDINRGLSQTTFL